MSDNLISRIEARQILDCRGNPTIEVDVSTGLWRGRAKVPSGASVGAHEALELRDNSKEFAGRSVYKAIKNVSLIQRTLKGMDVRRQAAIDKTMIRLDGTANKSRLGANAVLGVSLAASRAASHCRRMHYFQYLGALSSNRRFVIPVPFMNVINGGKHADNRLPFQEFMIVPLAKTFTESLQQACETYYILKKLIKAKYRLGSTNVGDEGGFAPPIKNVRDALDLIVKAIDQAGYSKSVRLALDVAASSFFSNNHYKIDTKMLSSEQLLRLYASLVEDYPIISIEDPFQEEGFSDFAALTKRLGRKIRIVGDDLTCSNLGRIAQAISYKSCNTLVLKVNQVGTLSEAIKAAHLAKRSRWGVMVAHRSGETEDTFIADFAVGLGCGMIKAGAPCRGERTAKYNDLLRLEEHLGKKALYGSAMVMG